ncbi:hypothetical protein ACLE20_13275 [Rhizobium sp. YIM 134829]|uniref:hypothetical protein n=1 Tax=Rhizobium sp. YIM 134829 TaxID=3390453 RepID=UPI00397A3557
MDLENRVRNLEIDLRIADARADAALQIAFKLFEIIKENGLAKHGIEDTAPRVFRRITEREDAAYELALLDVWESDLIPRGLRPGEAYIADQQRRIRLRSEIEKEIHADHQRTE